MGYIRAMVQGPGGCHGPVRSGQVGPRSRGHMRATVQGPGGCCGPGVGSAALYSRTFNAATALSLPALEPAPLLSPLTPSMPRAQPSAALACGGVVDRLDDVGGRSLAMGDLDGPL